MYLLLYMLTLNAKKCINSLYFYLITLINYFSVFIYFLVLYQYVSINNDVSCLIPFVFCTRIPSTICYLFCCP